MSMSHKAFVFDYNSFSSQFLGILLESLEKINKEKLIDFIQQNIENIQHPDEGLSVDSLWQNLIKVGDVQEYADFALTKFYYSDDDIGLDYEWQDVEKILNEEFLLDSNLILLGRTICFADNCFDPGRMGSYFQSFDEVQENLKIIKKYLEQKPEFLNSLQVLIGMFQNAVIKQQGLYITF